MIFVFFFLLLNIFIYYFIFNYDIYKSGQIQVFSKKILDEKLSILLLLDNNITFKSDLYLYIFKLIWPRSIRLLLMRIRDLQSKISLE